MSDDTDATLKMIALCMTHQDGERVLDESVPWSYDDHHFLAEKMKTQETLPEPEVRCV